MAKSWIYEDRCSEKYEMGLENFFTFAKTNTNNAKKVPCPCSKCVNFKKRSFKVVREHCHQFGFSLGYTNWIWHGEPAAPSCDITPTEGKSAQFPQFGSETVEMCEAAFTGEDDFDEESTEFRKFVEDAQRPLFEGSDHTKLDALVKLHTLKAKFAMSDTCFNEILETVSSLLPHGNVLPQTLYESKKTLNKLGLEYKKIHACPNDCILYRNQYADANSCPQCGLSRWKLTRDGIEKEGQPAKVLWYFPIIPRIRRWFKSAETAELLTWHDDNRSKDGYMRHPVDSPAWKLVDYKCPEFGKEARNLRMGLAANGINPHSNMSSYNLPPWLCMKRKFITLSLLISGLRQPGVDIDVYLVKYPKVFLDISVLI